ncbi:hypothetical protein BC826DRAFT_707808 [Russula brevipes]|nr:hypothetical protein BC826DRAFT_707808 [Russula brevipes]
MGLCVPTRRTPVLFPSRVLSALSVCAIALSASFPSPRVLGSYRAFPSLVDLARTSSTALVQCQSTSCWDRDRPELLTSLSFRSSTEEFYNNAWPWQDSLSIQVYVVPTYTNSNSVTDSTPQVPFISHNMLLYTHRQRCYE